MQSISVVFSTLHCEGYITDLRYCWLITSISARWLIEILSAILKSMRHGGQSTERCIAFGVTRRSPAFTTHKFMSENLRVNIWRDNFTSDYVRVNLPSRNFKNIKSDLSKLSTLSGPSIVKFIENQSEHLSKLTLYHLKKCATKRSGRAREPSRIPLAFLRGLNEKNSMLKNFVFK